MGGLVAEDPYARTIRTKLSPKRGMLPVPTRSGSFGDSAVGGWNGRYSDDARGFWRGVAGLVGPMANRFGRAVSDFV